uniref:Histone H2A n=1 Tax=Timema cristinae TaxID=61476 RepID=A0A7R9CQE1_TIMCR|nr:unnamed protein product [Timema cristinae]
MIHHLLRKGNYSEQVGAGFPVSLAGVMKYVAAKVLEIARKKPRATRKPKSSRVNRNWISIIKRSSTNFSQA